MEMYLFASAGEDVLNLDGHRRWRSKRPQKDESSDILPEELVTNRCTTKGDFNFARHGALLDHHNIREIRTNTF